MNEDPISETLGLTPIEALDGEIQEVVKTIPKDSNAVTDFECARDNIHVAIQAALEAIDDLKDIARQSQHPRAFEVLSSLVSTTVDASERLLNLQTKIRDIKKMDGEPTGIKSQTINNNLYVGSTADLQKMIEEMRNKNG